MAAKENTNSAAFFMGSAHGITGFGGVAASFKAGTRPAAAAAADFDQDGFADAIAASLGGSDVTLFPGSAGFPAGGGPGSVLPTGVNPRALAIADFDRDGYPDLVTADSASGSATHFRGGPANLAAERAATLTVGIRPWALASGDIDGDGFPDLLLADNSSGTIHFLRGEVDGLKAAGEEASGNTPAALSLGDHDGDGFLDAALANQGSGSITVFRGGPPILRRVSGFRAGLGPASLTSGDYDGDGFPDLLAANRESGDATVFRGGLEGLRRAGNVTGLTKPLSMVSGNFDGQSPDDALVASSTDRFVTLLQGSRSGDFLATDIQVVRSTFFGNPVAMARGDCDGDGIEDAAVALGNAISIAFLKGLPAAGEFGGGFDEANVQNFNIGTSPRALTSGDFNRDGLQDILVANSGGRSASLFHGDRAAGLTRAAPGEIATGDGPEAIIAGDIDGDGWLDAVSANRGSGDVTLLRGSPGGLWRLEPAEIAAGSEPAALAARDFNADGFLDVLAASLGSRSVTLLRGGPEGLIAARTSTLQLELSPHVLLAGDLDGDGFPDAAAADASASGMILLRGSPAGLVRGLFLETGPRPAALLGADFDRDGFLDLASADSGSGSIGTFRQLYLTPHDSRWVDPREVSAPAELQDPRFPPRYRLEISNEVLGDPMQVALIPGPIFELPQEEARARGAFYQIIADPVTILRESTLLNGSAPLTLRLRDEDPALLAESAADPGRIRVFRRDPAGGIGVLVPGPLDIVELAGRSAARFPIDRFGTYIVVLERLQLALPLKR